MSFQKGVGEEVRGVGTPREAGGAGKGMERGPQEGQACPQPWLQSRQADFRLLISRTAGAELASFQVLTFVLTCYSISGSKYTWTLEPDGLRWVQAPPLPSCVTLGDLGQATNSSCLSLLVLRLDDNRAHRIGFFLGLKALVFAER